MKSFCNGNSASGGHSHGGSTGNNIAHPSSVIITGVRLNDYHWGSHF